jgi:hypothetical protein
LQAEKELLAEEQELKKLEKEIEEREARQKNAMKSGFDKMYKKCRL